MADVAFEGEIQFRRWSDSSTQGVQVTFALPDSEALEPLKHKAGKRFMAVLVEIGDDEQPVQQPQRKDTRGPLCKEACDYCAMPEFQRWVGSFGYTKDEIGAKAYIVNSCNLKKSRSELDQGAEAAELFRTRIRAQFIRWQQVNRGQERATR